MGASILKPIHITKETKENITIRQDSIVDVKWVNYDVTIGTYNHRVKMDDIFDIIDVIKKDTHICSEGKIKLIDEIIDNLLWSISRGRRTISPFYDITVDL